MDRARSSQPESAQREALGRRVAQLEAALAEAHAEARNRARAEQARPRENIERLALESLLDTSGEMIAGLAHQLNQPLAAIVNYARGGLRRFGAGMEPELARALASTAEQAERAGEILRQLRRSLRRSEHRPLHCSLHELVGDTVELMASRAREKQVTVELGLELADDGVHADPVGVQQVLGHLLRHAFERVAALPVEARRVCVSTGREPDGFLRIEVRDPCPCEGLQAAEFETHYFDVKGGLATGRAFVEATVEAHGGRLWCPERPDAGAAFCFTLPPSSEKMSP